jgi:hypothetical protein
LREIGCIGVAQTGAQAGSTRRLGGIFERGNVGGYHGDYGLCIVVNESWT